jgi:hypothetical protein
LARERWFWAQGRQRRGPVLLTELVESVLGQPDPPAVLVWRKGFAEWTRAEAVPEVQRRMAPFVARREEEEGATRRAGRPAVSVAESSPPAPSPAGSNAAVYGGIAAGLAVMGLLAWLFWPRPQSPQAVPLGGSSAENAPAVVIPAGSGQAPPARASAAPGGGPATQPAAAAGAAPAASDPAAAATVAARETALPAPELRKLRGVAAWSGDRLTLTVYNGTAWRVTEIQVRVARFDGDDLVEDPRPVRLLPPRGEVDEGVADLLSKVAPDRRKAGLNALDTGPFEGRAGPRPENFRWEIESARGYAPR